MTLHKNSFWGSTLQPMEMPELQRVLKLQCRSCFGLEITQKGLPSRRRPVPDPPDYDVQGQ